MNSRRILIGIAIALGLLIVISIFSYNGMVNRDENVTQAWNNVQSQYQRRADLIGNLAKTVMKAASTEQKILTEVQQARSNATSVRIDANNLSPENIQKFESSQNQLMTSFNKLLAVSENYPQLASIPQFAQLNYEISGTENRISTARNDFNNEVMKYNKSVRRFPSNIFARIFGFDTKTGFTANQGADQAPDLDKIYDKQ